MAFKSYVLEDLGKQAREYAARQRPVGRGVYSGLLGEALEAPDLLPPASLVSMVGEEMPGAAESGLSKAAAVTVEAGELDEDFGKGVFGSEVLQDDKLLKPGLGPKITGAEGRAAAALMVGSMPDELDAGIFGDEVYLPPVVTETRGGVKMEKGLVSAPGGGYEYRPVPELEKEMEAEAFGQEAREAAEKAAAAGDESAKAALDEGIEGEWYQGVVESSNPLDVETGVY